MKSDSSPSSDVAHKLDLLTLIMPPAEPNQIGAPEEWMWAVRFAPF
jgi:hypothetical protein